MAREIIQGLNNILGSTKYNQKNQHAMAVLDYMKDCSYGKKVDFIKHILENFGNGSIKPTDQYIDFPEMSYEEFVSLNEKTGIAAFVENIINERRLPVAEAAREILGFIDGLKSDKEKAAAMVGVMYAAAPYPISGLIDMGQEEWAKVIETHAEAIKKIEEIAKKMAKEKIRFFKKTDEGKYILDLILGPSADERVRVVLMHIFAQSLTRASRHNPCGCTQIASLFG